MTKKIFPMVGAFKVHRALADDFMNWMEQDHFPKMHKTGHFEPNASLKIPLSNADDKGMCTVIYIHEVQSSDDWNRYVAIHRPTLRAEFMARWGNEITAGNLVPVVGADLAKELFFETKEAEA